MVAEAFGGVRLIRRRCVCDGCLARCNGYETSVEFPFRTESGMHRRIDLSE